MLTFPSAEVAGEAVGHACTSHASSGIAAHCIAPTSHSTCILVDHSSADWPTRHNSQTTVLRRSTDSGRRSGLHRCSAVHTCRLCARHHRAVIPPLSVRDIIARQQVEARLDDMDTYTSGDLLKLCDVYILKHPPALVLVELGVMSSADRERYIVLDTQHRLFLW